MPNARIEREPMPEGEMTFGTTQWSVVTLACDASAPGVIGALERLCQAYWHPLYAFVRRQGYDAHAAKDLTQGFFERLLEKDYLAQVDRAKGKFRSFLLACLRHYLSDQRDRDRALRRGGGAPILSLDELTAENLYRSGVRDTMSPDQVFERRWAFTLLERAQNRLRGEYDAAGKSFLFERLGHGRRQSEGGKTYAELARELGATEKAVRSEAYRMRRRFHELVCEEIGQTVSSRDDLEEEIRHLLSVLCS